MSFPKGESGKDFVERFSNGVKQMIAENEPGNLAAVCHGGHILFGLKEICANTSGKRLWGKIISNCSITYAEIWMNDNEPTGRLLYWANADHLPKELVNSK